MSDTALRPRLETDLKTIEGDLKAALIALGDEGWWIMQLMPQPEGKVVVCVQRRGLAITTDLSSVPPNLRFS